MSTGSRFGLGYLKFAGPLPDGHRRYPTLKGHSLSRQADTQLVDRRAHMVMICLRLHRVMVVRTLQMSSSFIGSCSA
jgi:hypothetical protein